MAVAIVFIETRQILSDNMHILEGSAFKDLCLPITCENQEQITDFIVRLYYKHIHSNIPKTKNLYQKIDLAILWLLNTTSCQCQMIVVYFIFKIVSDNKIYCENCYNNCMYDYEEAR